MNFNSIKVYFKLTRGQQLELKKVMRFVKRKRKAEKHKQKMRRKSSLVLSSP